jgi:multiple sugar transport system permease protein
VGNPEVESIMTDVIDNRTTAPVRPRRRKPAEPQDRSNVSPIERRRGTARIGLAALTTIVIIFLAVISAGPLVWLAKFATSTSADIIQHPMSLWPHGIQLHNLTDAWHQVQVGRYLLNTMLLAVGNVFFTLLVALTGAYGIAILRPRYAKVINAGVLATLFIPGVVSLISQYLTILDMPLIHLNLINTFFAVWLPAAANSFNVLLVSRFFAGLSGDVIEAAQIDGAGNLMIFWRLVLPMSRPIIGVIALLSVVGAWKEFLWPLLVLPDESLQPLSVGLYRIADSAPQGLLMAGMFISVIIPLALFLLFQRQFLRSAGQVGAVKG